jgi:hypothetical protein
MSPQSSIQQPAKSHNQAGCPYLNQTGAEAVLDWSSVLAGIDLAALPSDLQAELHQLQLKSGTPVSQVPVA